MRPRDHVILGSAASAGLWFLPGVDTLHLPVYFWLSSILIDIDHYLDYIYNNRFTDYSFKRMLAYHTLLYHRRFDPAFLNLSIFHTVESMAVLGALAFFAGSATLLYIWWGFLFHIICDTLMLIYDGKPSIRSNTIMGYFFKIKRLKLQGLDTKAIYTMAVNEARGNCGN